jgi:hypothetical protein
MTTFGEIVIGLGDGRDTVSSFSFVTPFIVSLTLMSRLNLSRNCGIHHKHRFVVNPRWRPSKDEAWATCRVYSLDGWLCW